MSQCSKSLEIYKEFWDYFGFACENCLLERMGRFMRCVKLIWFTQIGGACSCVSCCVVHTNRGSKWPLSLNCLF